MDAKSSDMCYMLERPIVDKLVSDWCVTASHANQTFEALYATGELAYNQSLQWLCDLAYVSASVKSKALDVRAAAMLSVFVGYGLRYEDLLQQTTLDCADYTVALAADFRLAPPRRLIDYVGKLAAAPVEAQIAKFAQLQYWFLKTLADVEAQVVADKAHRLIKKRVLAFKARRAEIKETIAVVDSEVDALHKVERTRLHFHLKYFKDDLYAFKQCLDEQDARSVTLRWAQHKESVKTKRILV